MASHPTFQMTFKISIANRKIQDASCSRKMCSGRLESFRIVIHSMVTNNFNPRDQICLDAEATHLEYSFLRLAMEILKVIWNLGSDVIDGVNQETKFKQQYHKT